MPERVQFQTSLTVSPELQALLKEMRGKKVSEKDLREQRVSFAFGNALASDRITKDSVKHASEHIRLTE